jgi:hypothetical protein
MRADPPDPLAHQFIRLDETLVGGYVFDPVNPLRRFVIEIHIGDALIGLCRADSYDPDLAARFGTDGAHAFVFELTENVRHLGHVVHAVLANFEIEIGERINLEQHSPAGHWLPSGRIDGVDGQTLFGFVGVDGLDPSDHPSVVARDENNAVVAIGMTRRYDAAARSVETPLLVPFELRLPSGTSIEALDILDSRGRPLDRRKLAVRPASRTKIDRITVIACVEPELEAYLSTIFAGTEADLLNAVVLPPESGIGKISKGDLLELLNGLTHAAKAVCLLMGPPYLAPNAFSVILDSFNDDATLLFQCAQSASSEDEILLVAATAADLAMAVADWPDFWNASDLRKWIKDCSNILDNNDILATWNDHNA